MKRTLYSVYSVVLCASLVAGQAVWAEAGKDGNTRARTNTEEARAILDAMATLLSEAQNFSVTMRTSYDAVQASGQKIEFGGVSKILVNRPNRFRSDVRQSDGDSGVVVSDGKAVTVFNATHNVYANLERPGNIDDTIRYVVGKLGLRLPLARMFVTTLPADLKRKIIAADYVEKNTLTEVPTNHIAARTRDVDIQVWVDAGEKPFPRRIVITYKQAVGEPQFRAEFSDWNLTPEVTAEAFSVTPPASAERIPFLTPVAQTGGVR